MSRGAPRQRLGLGAIDRDGPAIGIAPRQPDKPDCQGKGKGADTRAASTRRAGEGMRQGGFRLPSMAICAVAWAIEGLSKRASSAWPPLSKLSNRPWTVAVQRTCAGGAMALFDHRQACDVAAGGNHRRQRLWPDIWPASTSVRALVIRAEPDSPRVSRVWRPFCGVRLSATAVSRSDTPITRQSPPRSACAASLQAGRCARARFPGPRCRMPVPCPRAGSPATLPDAGALSATTAGSLARARGKMGQGGHDIAQFRQPLESSFRAIARLCRAFQVVRNVARVIGRTGICQLSRRSALWRLSSVEMAATMSVSSSRCAASWNDAPIVRSSIATWAGAGHAHAGQVVVGPCPQDSRGQRDGIEGNIDGNHHCPVICHGRHDTGQARQREGRIVGVAARPHADVSGQGRDFGQEVGQMAAQPLGREAVVMGQVGLDVLHRHGFGGAIALWKERTEGGKVDGVVAQAGRAVRPLLGQIGRRPARNGMKL